MMIAGRDKEKRTMDIAFFILGANTSKPASLREGESVTSIAYPLGKPSEAEKSGTVIRACSCFGFGSILTLIKSLEKKCDDVIDVVPASKKFDKLEKG